METSKWHTLFQAFKCKLGQEYTETDLKPCHIDIHDYEPLAVTMQPYTPLHLFYTWLRSGKWHGVFPTDPTSDLAPQRFWSQTFCNLTRSVVIAYIEISILLTGGERKYVKSFQQAQLWNNNSDLFSHLPEVLFADCRTSILIPSKPTQYSHRLWNPNHLT